MVDFNIVTEFEKRIAEFFGAPYAVATDSCTHAVELVLRYKRFTYLNCPINTYLSIPMLAKKLNIPLTWVNNQWQKYYFLSSAVIDAATFWEKGGYKSHSIMCLSFQYQKHLSLGRGGMILVWSEQYAHDLKKMSYDGRLLGIPWREQDIDTIGYHYYMTPETAALGLEKLPEAIKREPRIWSWKDYPDLTKMKIFQ